MRDLPELFVLRHGETVWNAESRMQGGLDSPLTPLGRAQALAMGRRLAAEGVSTASHAVLTSPQARARDTARLALSAGRLGAEPEVVADLREIGMGRWSGRTRAEIEARWPAPPDEGLMGFYDRAAEGEGLAALWERAGRVLAALDRPAILVTHGMTSRCLRARALGLAFAAIEDLPGGQGIVYRLRAGRMEALPGLDADAPALARPAERG